MAEQLIRTFNEDGELVEESTVEVDESPSTADRIAALEAEVRGMKDRAATVTVTGDAAKVRDAVTGKP
jgi:hypothetical protein